MKLFSPLSLGFALVAIALCACDDVIERTGDLRLGDRANANADASPEASARAALTDGPARSTEWAKSIHDSAEAAFAALDGPPIRSESRIGPQPWPGDLPARWPMLGEATVVADTKRREGDRLLLVNVPFSPERAMDAYQSALRERGYEVQRPQSGTGPRALHAQSPDHEAVLTFFPREKVTRIEILFLARATG